MSSRIKSLLPEHKFVSIIIRREESDRNFSSHLYHISSHLSYFFFPSSPAFRPLSFEHHVRLSSSEQIREHRRSKKEKVRDNRKEKK